MPKKQLHFGCLRHTTIDILKRILKWEFKSTI